MTAKTLTFVTYCDLPDLDADDRLVADEMRKRGWNCKIADWRNPDIDWAAAGNCVLRSTWDYHLHYEEFLSWIDKVSSITTLWNRADLVRWNTDKRYLIDLARASIPIVPTAVIERATDVNLSRLIKERGWKGAILKPTVGLSTFGVRKFDSSDESAQIHLESILRTSDALVQPFIKAVHERGERALVFIGDKYSHTIRKSAFQPLAQAGEAGETLVEADESELRFAREVLTHVKGPVAFARVDLIRDIDGQDLLMELELVEPSLYLNMYPDAISLLADRLCQLATLEPNARVQ